jgi:hypothetical protein
VGSTEMAVTKPESDSWFLIPAGISEFRYLGYEPSTPLAPRASARVPQQTTGSHTSQQSVIKWPTRSLQRRRLGGTCAAAVGNNPGHELGLKCSSRIRI